MKRPAGKRLAPSAAALAGLICLGAEGGAQGETEASGLLDQLMRVQTEHLELLSQPMVPASFRQRIEALTDELQPALAAADSPAAIVETLNRFVFQHLQVRSSEEMRDSHNLLLSDVLHRKQGYCVGIAALYLVLAERSALPIHAVATPSHIFLRYDDGAARINIETSQQGHDIPDGQYAREQRMPEESIRRGVFMRNLTADEFLAQVHNNLGVIWSERKEYGRAAAEYQRAIALHPKFPAAFYNLGNDLLARGEHREAIRQFSRALRLYPTDVWALNNRGLAYLGLGKREKARRDFEEALRIDPGFEPAQRNLERISTG